MTEMRRCTKCGNSRPLTDYHLAPRAKGGRLSICPPCRTEWQRAYREARRDAGRWGMEGWKRLSPAMLNAKLPGLLRAAYVAHRAGRWQGRDALRAYRELTVQLERFGVKLWGDE